MVDNIQSILHRKLNRGALVRHIEPKKSSFKKREGDREKKKGKTDERQNPWIHATVARKRNWKRAGKRGLSVTPPRFQSRIFPHNASRLHRRAGCSGTDRVVPNPSPETSSGNGPPAPLAPPRLLSSILYIVVGGYSRLPDLYTATGSSRSGGRIAERVRERENEWTSICVCEKERERGRKGNEKKTRGDRAWVVQGERLHCLIETSETLFVVGNHKNTILCVNTGPVCWLGTRRTRLDPWRTMKPTITNDGWNARNAINKLRERRNEGEDTIHGAPVFRRPLGMERRSEILCLILQVLWTHTYV